MATTTAMNRWTEELVASLLPANAPPSKTRRLKTSFHRSLRYHNYGRTNQFEVEERLTGLEEKFQVLDHDELSDALHARRDELQQHFEQWIPDVLDFLLRMSKDPMAADGVEKLQNVVVDDLIAPQLTWAEIEKDDPVDRKDRMWRVPHFSDSSDEELVEDSEATSPASIKQALVKLGDDELTPRYDLPDHEQLLEDLRRTALDGSQEEVLMTEIQVIRETLFMLQGLPTSLFSIEGRQIKQDRRCRVAHMSSEILASILSQARLISRTAALVRNWHPQGEHPSVHVLQDGVHALAHEFDTLLSDEHASALDAMKHGGVCSLLAVLDRVRHRAQATIAAAQFVSSSKDRKGVELLQTLFEHVCKLELCGQRAAFERLLSIFCEALRTYTTDIEQWVEDGRLPEKQGSFFVDRVPDQADKAKLWHNWFLQNTAGPNLLPDFMQIFSTRIFVAGKTMAFCKSLPQSSQAHETLVYTFESFTDAVDAAKASSMGYMVPFAPTLFANLQRYIDERLSGSSTALQQSLKKHCNLQATLSALSHLYLADAPNAFFNVEEEIFSALDRRHVSWNDPYVVSDLLEDAFSDTSCIDACRITIQSERLPSSTLLEKRRSVKTLESFAVDYRLPWPIANIISTDSIAAYRRVALVLSQIRRARYVLERHAFPNLQRHAKTRISIEAIFSNLLLFTSILYSHLMHCAVEPLTSQLRSRMVGTVDEMIAVHKAYTNALERVCLTTKSLKVLRETLTAMLDLCVGFGFQVAEAKSDIDDFALSKVKTQFRKYTNLLVAGLRGSARAGSGTGPVAGGPGFGGIVSEVMTLLADSLESAGFKM